MKLEDFFGRLDGEIVDRAAFVEEAMNYVRLNEASSSSNFYIVGVGYDGEKGVAYLKLYGPEDRKIHRWYDNSFHKPYCFSKLPLEEVEEIEAVAKHPGLLRLESVEKYDALRDQRIYVTKIVAKDPLSIGGRPSGSIRDLIKAWEADIKYVESYMYDRGIVPGMRYTLMDGDLRESWPPIEATPRFKVEYGGEEYGRLLRRWITLLECPVPDYLRAAVDIEVYSEADRIPDPGEASKPIICISVIGSDGRKIVLLLKRERVEEGVKKLPEGLELRYYEDEVDLISEAFSQLSKYPVIVTFNGDDFDLKYLYHRALNLGFTKETIPIILFRDYASLVDGIHIDLYKFFFNRSIQVYAFSQRYRENTLDEVGRSLIQTGKMEIDKPISELPYMELAAYCFRDAEINLKLTSFNDDLVMKLMTLLSRISCLTLEDVSRQGVSSWIRSMLYREHRVRGVLIPRSDEILELKGFTTTKAIIKGKKYKGAIVVEPKPGIHFNVAVLDFASLYPSIIKMWNLGYETVLCPHEDSECRENKVPDTPLWVCKKNTSLESLLIGSLRDLRVKWYKHRSRDRSISENLRSLYNVIQNALKVVLNASYGVFGAESFSLYCPPVAEATAAIGRFLIGKAIEKAEALGVDVVYGDTDSIFLGNPDKEQLEELLGWSERELGMELEIDKQYRYVALSSRKKNYLGVLQDGSVDVKGLTGKKRHIPRFIKRAFYEMIDILSRVRSEEEFERAKGLIREIVVKCYFGLKNRSYPLDELAFSVMISKATGRYDKTTPQHVKAAKLLEGRGYEVKPGDIISFVKVVGEPGVKPCRLASINEVDVKKYLEYMDSTFEQVLDALGLSFEELIGNRRLESFFA
ncbi:MAG: DNA-directed DNA polymerase I [Candidatus Bathyarchaeia archaeon]